MRILLDDESPAGVGAPAINVQNPPIAPAPAAPPTPAPAGPPVPAADTVNAGQVTEETELLRVKLAAAEKRNGELETAVKSRETEISQLQNEHHEYRQRVEGDKPLRFRVGMFRKG